MGEARGWFHAKMDFARNMQIFEGGRGCGWRQRLSWRLLTTVPLGSNLHGMLLHQLYQGEGSHDAVTSPPHPYLHCTLNPRALNHMSHQESSLNWAGIIRETWKIVWNDIGWNVHPEYLLGSSCRSGGRVEIREVWWREEAEGDLRGEKALSEMTGWVQARITFGIIRAIIIIHGHQWHVYTYFTMLKRKYLKVGSLHTCI